ncbi:biotin--[acetyl-CoA-carboxylase] ligase [Ammoniphilus oxalaticus]|uniref:biotin--[acetyl-CoA-carboxylase] ligase n=1 Tax=Ammoniphilus oxalaticus TaxID=66863 RepID=UPI001FE448A6|nr:biotin--[acetyl-CoA-carboxylase] ligase [Ammoniphilus oxalaticus]
MKEQILRLFKEANGQFVSGEALSEALGCSRTAIWKHISELRAQGYQFEAVRRSGYRLLATPDIPYAEQVKAGLNTQRLGCETHFFETVESTQTEIHALARAGAPEGTVVIADEQVKGKGRLGRSWHSPPGSGIWMSVLLRPKLELQRCPQLTLVAAVAIVETIREQTGLPLMIKWPNDLLLNGKKVCGILTELRAESDCVDYIALGIGINVSSASFPSELADIATSLSIEQQGQAPLRTPLIKRLLEKLEELYFLYVEQGFSAIKPRWEAHALMLGKPITARRVNSATLQGIAIGIDEQGALLLRMEDGRTEHIYSADIDMG